MFLTTPRVFYHGRALPVTLPPHWRLLAAAEPRDAPALPDPATAVREIVAHPLGMPPLAEVVSGLAKQRTVIISEDLERPTPVHRLLPPLLAELKRLGIADAAIDVIIGRGTHRLPSPAEVAAKLGPEAVARVRVSVHDPDAADLVELGSTSRGTVVRVNRLVAEAGLIIGIGTANVHYFAGYGGGPKLILPGVCARSTIRQNHVWVRDPQARAGVTTGNPIWEDMLEASRLARYTLAINALPNACGEVHRLFGGEVAAQQEAWIRVFKDIYGVPVPGLADVTIACGYPLEMSLIQSGKAVMMADTVTKPGGAIVLVSACRDGAGPMMYETLRQRPRPEEVIDWIADGRASTTGGTMASRVRRMLESKRLLVVTDGLSPEQLAEMGMEHAPSLEAALAALSGRGPQEAIILPVGGSTFPYLVRE